MNVQHGRTRTDSRLPSASQDSSSRCAYAEESTMPVASIWARQTQAMRALIAACWLASLLTLIQPAVARAALASGGMAVVTTPSADLYLRDGPNQGSDILASLPPGTQVLVLDGPTTDADGLDWYHVSAAGQSGRF